MKTCDMVKVSRVLRVALLAFMVFAFLANGVLAIVTPSSYTFTRLTDNGYVPRFSPNGKWITYARLEGSAFQVVVQKIDDPATVTVVDDGTDFPYGVGIPVWSSDGKTIYFVDLPGTVLMARNIWIKGDRIVVGDRYTVYDPPGDIENSIANFDISRNGRFIVFWSELGSEGPAPDDRFWPDLFLIPRRPDGTFNHEDRIQLTFTAGLAEYEPRFSPNGKEIAFWATDDPWGEEIPRLEVISIDSHGNPIEDSRRVVMDLACWPFWSPDGKRLGVTKHHIRSYYTPSDIWVIDAETGDLLWEVTTDGKRNYAGDWSPTDWNSMVFRKVGTDVTGLWYAKAQH